MMMEESWLLVVVEALATTIVVVVVWSLARPRSVGVILTAVVVVALVGCWKEGSKGGKEEKREDREEIVIHRGDRGKGSSKGENYMQSNKRFLLLFLELIIYIVATYRCLLTVCASFSNSFPLSLLLVVVVLVVAVLVVALLVVVVLVIALLVVALLVVAVLVIALLVAALLVVALSRRFFASVCIISISLSNLTSSPEPWRNPPR